MEAVLAGNSLVRQRRRQVCEASSESSTHVILIRTCKTHSGIGLSTSSFMLPKVHHAIAEQMSHFLITIAMYIPGDQFIHRSSTVLLFTTLPIT